jgi:hypothetical protein
LRPSPRPRTAMRRCVCSKTEPDPRSTRSARPASSASSASSGGMWLAGGSGGTPARAASGGMHQPYWPQGCNAKGRYMVSDR